MKKYSIVIPTYNHLEDCLKPCLESIIKFTDFSNGEIEIIVVANGCMDGTEAYLSTFNKKSQYDYVNIRMLSFHEPIGFTRAVNEGIMASQGDYVIILNNDTKLQPQKKNTWLDILEKPFNELSNVGITGPHKLHSYITCSDFLVFFCVMIKRELFNRLGLLDEDFSPGGCEDIAFCYKAKQAGYDVVRVPDENTGKQMFPIVHQAEATMNDNPKWAWTFEQNTRLLINKYSKVAVVMPVYNDETFIKASVAAVFLQSFKNLELFLINDASTDGTSREVNDFLIKKPSVRISMVNLPFNVGPSNARNIALSRIKKDPTFTHVAFCDSDDFWFESHLEESLLLLDKKKADVVYSDVDSRFVDGKEALSFGISNPDVFDIDKLFESNFIYISSIVATRSAIMDAQFDSKLDSIEDWDFWCQIAKKGMKFYHNKNKHLIYTVKTSGNSASNLSTEKTLLIREKHKLIKLNLGCGTDLKKGYINCDLYPKDKENIRNVDCQFLPFGDNSVDEILASHLIEHFPFLKIGDILKEWHRALRPGGKLVLETPDAYHTYKSFVERPDLRVTLMGHIHAFPMEPGNAHFFLWTEDHLKWFLGQIGFKGMKRIQPFSWYVQNHPKEWYLALEAYK